MPFPKRVKRGDIGDECSSERFNRSPRRSIHLVCAMIQVERKSNDGYDDEKDAKGEEAEEAEFGRERASDLG